jgi:hypothetical protein
LYLAWNVHETIHYLKQHNIHQHDLKLLQHQQLDGNALRYLNDSLLLKMGIEIFGRRCKIMKCVQKLLFQKQGKANQI